MKTENKKQTNKENNTMKTLTQHTTIEYLSLEDIADIYFDELEFIRKALKRFIRSESNLIFQLSNADIKDVTAENSRFNKNITLTKTQKAKMYYNLYNNISRKDKESIRQAIREELKKEICEEDKVNFHYLYTRRLSTLLLGVSKKAQKITDNRLNSLFEKSKFSKMKIETEKYVRNNDVAYKDEIIEFFDASKKNSFVSPSLIDDATIELNKIVKHIKKTHDLESFALKKLKEEVTYELRVADDCEKRYVKKSA